jgi:hypothetical protein
MAYYNQNPNEVGILLAELYDTSKPYERVHLPGGQTEGKVKSSRSTNRETRALRKERPRPGTDQTYAQEYQRVEEEAFQAVSIIIICIIFKVLKLVFG